MKLPRPARRAAAPARDDAGDYANTSEREENASVIEARSLRGNTIALILSLSLNVGLASALLLMIPLVTAVPYFVQWHDERGQLIEVKPLILGKEQGELLVENTIRQYVRIRNEVIPIESVMRERWEGDQSVVRSHSTPEVYSKFVLAARPIAQRIRNTSFRRTVRILTVNQQSKRVWHVEYETTDRQSVPGQAGNDFDDSSTIVRRWSAHLQLSRLRYSNTPTLEEKLRNPLGIVVSSYSTASITS